MNEKAPQPTERDGLLVNLSGGDDELLRRFRSRVRQEIATHLSLGQPIYYSGLGSETGKLFVRQPDGRRFEYQMDDAGSRRMVRPITP